MNFSGSTCIPEIFLLKRFLKTFSFSNTAVQKITGSESKVSSWRYISLRHYSIALGSWIPCPQRSMHQTGGTMSLFEKTQMQSRAILRLIEKKQERNQVKRKEGPRRKLEQLKETHASPNHSFIQNMPIKSTIWTIESSSLTKALSGRRL